MKLRTISIGLALSMVALLSLFGGSIAQAATSTATCVDGHWPATVNGRPTLFQSGALAGDYVWHDGNGWHVRVTHHGSDRLVFSGRIVSSASLDATPVKLEKNDVVTLSSDRRTITFRFVNYGAVDGFDFRTACAQRLTFTLNMGGQPTPVAEIWLGRGNVHPLENPFVVARLS